MAGGQPCFMDWPSRMSVGRWKPLLDDLAAPWGARRRKRPSCWPSPPPRGAIPSTADGEPNSVRGAQAPSTSRPETGGYNNKSHAEPLWAAAMEKNSAGVERAGGKTVLLRAIADAIPGEGARAGRGTCRRVGQRSSTRPSDRPSAAEIVGIGRGPTRIPGQGLPLRPLQSFAWRSTYEALPPDRSEIPAAQDGGRRGGALDFVQCIDSEAAVLCLDHWKARRRERQPCDTDW